MAVYRSDQAQLTFATEGAHGGYPEPATTVDAVSDGSAVIDLPAVGSTAAGLPAGSRSIYVDQIASGLTAGGGVITRAENGTGYLGWSAEL